MKKLLPPPRAYALVPALACLGVCWLAAHVVLAAWNGAEWLADFANGRAR